MTPYCPHNPYPLWWRLALFGRKNQKPNSKPQKPRKVKGRSKPPHKGGSGGKKKSGWF